MSTELLQPGQLGHSLHPGGVVASPGDILTALFQRHYQAVRVHAAYLVADADIDDVVAETFAVAVRRLDDIPTDRERAWLLGVLRKQASHHRRAEQRRAGLAGYLEAIRPATTTHLNAGGLSIEDRLFLAAAFDQLGDDDREVLLLALWHDLTGSGLAVALGITATAAGVRLYRARQRLASAMRRAEDDEAAS